MHMRKGSPLLFKIQLRMQPSAVLANPLCVSITTRKLALSKTPMKPRGLCTGTCVCSVSQRMVKTSNILRSIVEISRRQKTSRLGVGLPSARQFASKYVWSKIKDSKYTKQKLLANKCTILSWFHSFKAFDNRRHGRTYTQVLCYPLQGWYEKL